MPDSNELTDNPYIFTMSGAVEFADGDNAEKKKLRLTLYDGSVVPHWYWGNLAFDQSTMKMAKGRNPMLFDHDTNQRLAFSDRVEFEPKFVLEGRFLKTSTIAEEVRTQMDDGFPFEASLRFDPARSKIEYVKAGESAEVNGRTVKGPGTIVRHALIMEGSVCVFGALKNTKTQAFAENPYFKESIMGKDAETKMTVDKLTAETLAAECPELRDRIVEAARAEGVQAEKARFAELQKICGEDAGLIVQCFADGKSPVEASGLRVDKLTAETARLADENASLKAGKIDPAVTEFRNAPAPGSTGTFDEATASDEHLKEHFTKTPEVQGQFKLGGAEAYIEFVKAERDGKVRIVGEA